MQVIFTIAFLAVLINLLYRYSNAVGEANGRNGTEFTDVSNHIDRINDIRERLEIIENLIADISVCSPEQHHKHISFEWSGETGGNKRYDICVDGGNGNTKDILKFAYSERDRLRTSLRSETKKLSKSCSKGMEKKTI